MYYVYVLESKTRFYTGYTTDLKNRLVQHNAGQNIATKPYLPWKVVFYECYVSKEDALRREKYLKTSQGKQALKRMLASYLQNQKRYFGY